MLVARADGVMTGAYDLEEALRRVRAFDAAGADCLYVPMPGTAEALARVVEATGKPVNALAVGPLASLTRAEFARAGVARISLGSALARVTHRAIVDLGQAILERGDFSGLRQGLPGDAVDRLLGG